MTQIDFYTQLATPALFACRLCQTVYNKGERLLVWLPDEMALKAFSTRLWGFDDESFVPHCPVGADEAAETPIWLSCQVEVPASPAVLLNMTDDMPDVPQRFVRILELVGTDEASLAKARGRFKAYRSHGFAIDHHDMGKR